MTSLPAPLGTSPPPSDSIDLEHHQAQPRPDPHDAWRRAASLDWSGAWVDPQERQRMMSLTTPPASTGGAAAAAAAAPEPFTPASNSSTLDSAPSFRATRPSTSQYRRYPSNQSLRLVRPVARRASEDQYNLTEPSSPTSPPAMPLGAGSHPPWWSHRQSSDHKGKHQSHSHRTTKRTRNKERSTSWGRDHTLLSMGPPPPGSAADDSSALSSRRPSSCRRRRSSRRPSLKRTHHHHHSPKSPWLRVKRYWSVVAICCASLAWNWALYRFAEAWKLDVRAASLPAHVARTHDPRQELQTQSPWRADGNLLNILASRLPTAASLSPSKPLSNDAVAHSSMLFPSSSSPSSSAAATKASWWSFDKLWSWRSESSAHFTSKMAYDVPTVPSRTHGPQPVAKQQGTSFPSSSFLPWATKDAGEESTPGVRKDTSTLWPDLLRIYALAGLVCAAAGLVGVAMDNWKWFLVYFVQQTADFAIVVVDAIILAVSLYHPAMQLYVCYLFSPSSSSALVPENKGDSPTSPRGAAFAAGSSLGAMSLSLSSSSSSSSSSAFSLLSELTNLDYASAQCALRVRQELIPPLWAAILVSTALRSLVLIHTGRYMRHARWRAKRRGAHTRHSLPTSQRDSTLSLTSPSTTTIGRSPTHEVLRGNPLYPARSVGSGPSTSSGPKSMTTQSTVPAAVHLPTVPYLTPSVYLSTSPMQETSDPMQSYPDTDPLLGTAPGSFEAHAPEAQLLEMALQQADPDPKPDKTHTVP